MKKELYVGIFILVVIIAGSLIITPHFFNTNPTDGTINADQVDRPFATQTSDVYGKLSHNVSLTTAMPDNPEKILVYKLIPRDYSRQDIISLGEKFNISPQGRIKEGKESISISDDSGYIILYNNGAIEYTNTNRANTINPIDVPRNLPSDDEAIRIATNFLKERDLLPGDLVVEGTDHGKIYRVTKNDTTIVEWEDVIVRYRRMLNGLKAKGSGISIAVGGDGSVIELDSNVKNYTPYEEFSIKSPEAAFEDLKIQGVPVGEEIPETVSVNEIYLSYHARPRAFTEEYLEPVWVFKGNVMVNGSSVMAVEQYIPALKDIPKE